jgi:hypothetical protein
MTDETWQGIIIRSIPPMPKRLPVILLLYTISSSADIISTLLAHGMVLRRYITNRGRNPSNIVLAAQMSNGCTNPNCKAKKWSIHPMANCYWLGGGKEGQFPPGFSQKTKANTMMSTLMPVMSGTPVTAAISATKQVENFVLSAHIPDTPGQSGVLIDTPTSYPPMVISKGF